MVTDMINLIIGLHVTVCLFLIFVVLLQRGKGADMGAVFGGSTNTILGASGAVSLLQKVTTGAAIIFMCTSLYLAWSSSRKHTVFEKAKMLETKKEDMKSVAPGGKKPEVKKAPSKQVPSKKSAAGKALPVKATSGKKSTSKKSSPAAPTPGK